MDPLTLPAPVDLAELADEHYQRALKWQQAEHGAEIEKEVREAIRLRPRYTEYRRYLSGMLINQGRNVEALAEIKMAIKIAPYEDYLYETMWAVLTNMGRNEEAVGALKQACNVAKPKTPIVYYDLAKIYLNQGEAENARKVAERGLLCYQPNQHPIITIKPGLYLLLGDALLREGKKAEARIQWQKAVDMNLPNYTGWQESKKRLEENP